jgi:hypothetical protein
VNDPDAFDARNRRGRRASRFEYDDTEPDEPMRNRRLAGFVRVGLVGVIVFGAWIALSVRQQTPTSEPEPSTSPRAVIEVPAGYTATGLIQPDLSVADGSEGTWALLAADDSRLFGGRWVIAACREPSSREVGSASGLVTGTLGADFAVDLTDDGGVRVVAGSRDGVTSAMAIDRRPSFIVTVIASGWDGEAVGLARDVFEAASVDGCVAAPARAAALTGLALRQERTLDVPILPIGLRMVSADETAVAWAGASPAATIVLTTQHAGDGGDDADLLEFLRPAGDQEARVRVGDVPGYRADNVDGSELLIWQVDGVIHTLSLGADADADVVQLAQTLREPDAVTWQALADSVTR